MNNLATKSVSGKTFVFWSLVLIFTFFHGFPPASGKDCFSIWSDCLKKLQMEFEVENEGDPETEVDKMKMHYECTDRTIDEKKECLKEVTDGVCNPDDKELAISTGADTLEELNDYCEKWKLKF